MDPIVVSPPARGTATARCLARPAAAERGPRVTRAALAVALLAGGPACTPAQDDTGPDAIVGIEVREAEEVPTVAVVTWATTSPAECTVEFGPPGGPTLTTPASGAPSTSHGAFLVGLGPDTGASLRIRARFGDEEVVSEEVPFTTGPLPAGVPVPAHPFRDEDRVSPGYTLVPITSPEANWLTMLDGAGQIVWARRVGFEVQSMRLAPDGTGLFANQKVSPDTTAPEPGDTLHYLTWDGADVWAQEVPNAHHDFVVVDQDTLATLGWTTLVVDDGHGGEVVWRGDSILELRRDGTTPEPRVVWNIFDHLSPGEVPCVAPEDQEWAGDWSHGNYLRWDAEAGSYQFTARHLDAVFTVDRATGDTLWTMSNSWGDHQASGEDPILDWPHSIEPEGDGWLVFNQVADPAAQACSEAVVLTADPGTGLVFRSWTYQHEECLRVDYLGNAWPLENGNRLVVFSKCGVMDEVAPDGGVVDRIQLPLGGEFAYGRRVPSPYAALGPVP